MTLFNAFYDEHCYMPLHVYEGRSGKLITTILRPGKRPSGREITAILKRLVAYIRKRWPRVKIIVRADSHFSTPEVHEWCEENEVHYALGQSGNAVLKEQASGLLEKARSLYEITQRKIRLFTSFPYQAGTWKEPRRIICKVEVSDQGENIRFIVTSFESSQPSFLYETVYCARGGMENYIKNHKTFLHSDRTSCHSFMANQFRLFLHSAAYVLLHTLAEKGLKGTRWVRAQFNTLQNRILKVGARVHELVTKIRFHFPTSFPLTDLFVTILRNLAHAFP
ncbi:MAG: IS1380 family transposase [Candidatus Glassbacteria bacterium]